MARKFTAGHEAREKGEMAGRTPELDRDELALMAAYEASVGEAGANALSDELPAELAAELDDYLALERHIAELPLEPVAASVRGAIMNAAAEQADLHARPGPLAKILAMMLRPGPLLIGGTLAAVALAIVVREPPRPARGAAQGAGKMVALRSPEARAEGRAEPAVQRKRAAEAEKPARAVPRRTYPATPASLGPESSAEMPATMVEVASRGAKAAPGRGSARGPAAGPRPGRTAPGHRTGTTRAGTPAKQRPRPTAIAHAEGGLLADDLAGGSHGGRGGPTGAKAERASGNRLAMVTRAKAKRARRTTSPPGPRGGRSGGAEEQWPVTDSSGEGREVVVETESAKAEDDTGEIPSPAPTRTPMRSARSTRFAAPPPSAPSAPPARRQGAGKSAEAAENSLAAQRGSTKVAKLLAKLAITRNEDARIVLLRALVKEARRTGDLKTEHRAAKQLTALKTARARRLAARKSAPARPRTGSARRPAPVRPTDSAPAAGK